MSAPITCKWCHLVLYSLFINMIIFTWYYTMHMNDIHIIFWEHWFISRTPYSRVTVQSWTLSLNYLNVPFCTRCQHMLDKWLHLKYSIRTASSFSWSDHNDEYPTYSIVHQNRWTWVNPLDWNSFIHVFIHTVQYIKTGVYSRPSVYASHYGSITNQINSSKTALYFLPSSTVMTLT